jgi:hypothetical protein
MIILFFRERRGVERSPGAAKNLCEIGVWNVQNVMNFRKTGRHLGIHHQTVAYWIKQYTEKLPDATVPEQVKTTEMDEVFTFIGEKKRDLHRNGCRSGNSLHIGLESAPGTQPETFQAIVDESPKAQWYFSDAFLYLLPALVLLW